MREYVAILYQGSNYELGRGVQFYRIKSAGRPQPQPIEWWPESPGGVGGRLGAVYRARARRDHAGWPGCGPGPAAARSPAVERPAPGATVPAPPVLVQAGPGG